MYRALALVLLCHLVGGTYIGKPCSSHSDCRNGYLRPSSCVSGKCQCDTGYTGVPKQPFCSKVKIGSLCDNTPFCQAGVTDSVCDDKFHVCVCPPDRGEVSSFDTEPPKCVLLQEDPACNVCIQTGGSCYSDSGFLTCGCPCPYSSSGPSLDTGCDIKQARYDEKCHPDGSIVCYDPNTVCAHDGTLHSTYTCTCKTGYTPVKKSDDRNVDICARRINSDIDPDCAVCISNQGACFDLDGDNKMDGCQCPYGRTSPSTDVKDACTAIHFQVDCNTDYMTVCIDEEGVMNGMLPQHHSIYAENHRDYLNCHLNMVEQDRSCLNVSYNSGNRCGVKIAETEYAVSYSLWVVIQNTRVAISAEDVCIYYYCTYHKKTHTATGVINVTKKKLTASEGVSIRPEVDMSIQNKFREDVELVGGTLGDLVRLIIQVTDNKDIYTRLRAEVCVVSNMLSLDHPHAESAVFILDACPYQNSILTNPPPIFMDDPDQALTIITNFFHLPKLSSDVIFFQCCVKVCIDPADCAPKTCNGRRRRSLSHSGLTFADIKKQFPDTITKTIGVPVRGPVQVEEVKENDEALKELEKEVIETMIKEKSRPGLITLILVGGSIMAVAFILIVIYIVYIFKSSQQQTVKITA